LTFFSHTLIRECWDKEKGNRPTFAECKNRIAANAMSQFPQQWNQFLERLENAKNDSDKKTPQYVKAVENETKKIKMIQNPIYFGRE
jgi:hypothetical protein